MHDPHPVPAFVASHTAFRLRQPPSTAAMIFPFDTPLQLHTCASSGMSSTSTAGPPSAASGNSSSARFCGSTSPRSNACSRRGAVNPSPSSIAPATFPSRMITFLYTPRFGSTYDTTSSSSFIGSLSPATASSTPITFSFVEVFDPV